MKYVDFLARERFEQEELLAFGHGTLVDDPPEHFEARLPVPPMLMLDRVTELRREGPRGRIVGERDVRLDDWFFQCHFIGDPVQPGCLGVDGVWQLLGFFCNWAGGLGAGRALGCGEIEFFGQIRPHDGVVRYELDVLRYREMANSGASIAIADATVLVDDEAVYTIQRAKVGLFRDLVYADYPRASERSRGGKLS
ncbi:MAG: bifunctional 3-hydroxydecanoyl-ACP dehydratase/trans-2-decenoyl-ACP isomerase [Deltaproteobacteria bacterium]|nr:bifunctional 3-hydroxydecanoyl-ACP dehydratase/trans-2-decenoyl-ACP isomerase [Deltaproteobacteria bacterium]MBW2445181.1 bifunctional 3-hydroxydecanoyl-ACP dehydratase/trans-2-decenoyl-ACP isomerase [Deltaproteobacteria bacterium]